MQRIYNFRFQHEDDSTTLFEISINDGDNALLILKEKFEECIKKNSVLAQLIKDKYIKKNNKQPTNEELIYYFVLKVKTTFSNFKMEDNEHFITLNPNFWN